MAYCQDPPFHIITDLRLPLGPLFTWEKARLSKIPSFGLSMITRRWPRPPGPEAPPPNPPPPRAGCVLAGTHFFSERTPRLRASSPACAWAAASSWSWDSCSGPGEGEEKAGRPQIWWAGTAAVEGETVNTPAPAPHTLTALCQLRSTDILRHRLTALLHLDPPAPGPPGPLPGRCGSRQCGEERAAG